MFSFISSVAVFASENIFTDGTELDISENKKTNLYNVDNTANENDFIFQQPAEVKLYIVQQLFLVQAHIM